MTSRPISLGTDSMEALRDPARMASLREEIILALGLEDASDALFALAFAEGLNESVRFLSRFSQSPLPGACAPSLPLLFVPDTCSGEGRIHGTLQRSPEALVHVSHAHGTDQPSCWLSAGFASGWYSGLLHERVLVRETHCTAGGADACRFVGRTVEEWAELGDAWIEGVLPHVDFDESRARAEEQLLAGDPYAEEEEPEGSMLGNFDPMSPAMHVWGPVMVLPYSGLGDSQAGIDTIVQDLGPDQVRSVVIDVTGARITGIEAAGLVQLIEHMELRGIESVIVGLARDAANALKSNSPRLAAPILASDISEAIALAFQLSQGTQTPH
jgi:hypothetical protein